MAKAKPKGPDDRVRVCGKWQEKGYKASADEQQAYDAKQRDLKKAQKKSPAATK